MYNDEIRMLKAKITDLEAYNEQLQVTDKERLETENAQLKVSVEVLKQEEKTRIKVETKEHKTFDERIETRQKDNCSYTQANL